MPILHLKPKNGSDDIRPSIKARTRKFTSKKWLTTALAVCAGLALVFALVVSISLAWVSRDLPDPNTLITRDVPLTTRIYDRTGTHLLYEIHGAENRSLVQIKDLPAYVAHASVAIEDKTFYTHHGVSWQGLLRAFVLNTIQGKRIQGTSTLTQQLVKNAILTNERSLTRKLKEVLLSLQIERVFTKDQILQLYLNEIPYGSTIYGIEAASKNYFGKSAKDLTLDEAALLAAIPQAPDIYSPYGTGLHGDNRKALVNRQHYVLQQMAAQGYITQQESDDAQKVDTLKKLIPKRVGNISAPHFVMYVRSLLIDKYGQQDVETKGLKVITTLDWDKEQIAEDEVKKGVDARGKQYNFTNAGLIAIDPKNGQILSMVGSKDFFDVEHDGQVNVVLSSLQPGSSFKPIVYAAGFIKGYTPDTTLWDVNTTFKTDLKNYEPKNYDLKEHGPVTVRQALQGSLNIPAVKMLYLVGVGRVLDFAEQLGYTTFADRSRFGLSLVLGGGEVRLIDHANAYAAFANNGVQYQTSAILKVEDSTGKTLEEWKQPDGNQVIDPSITAELSGVLSDNNARAYVFGTHNYLTLPGRPVATKTGTTNNFHDAWTLGYTPSLVAGVWVGNNDNSEMKRGADGSQIAAPIWQGFMTRALQGSKVESFPPPPPIDQTLKPVLIGKDTTVTMKVDKVTGMLANDLTPPDQTEERTYHQAHDILYYVDKDDPRGPVPSDPSQDPQFSNWESSVQSWVQRNNWNTTSTPPTETDNIHTIENQPKVTITDPVQNAQLSSRTVNISVGISAPRQIRRVEVQSEGTLIGVKDSEPWVVRAQIPNSIDRGFHDLLVTAIDDAGNRGTATVTINLAADPTPLSLSITTPGSDVHLNAGSFPVTVTISSGDNTNANKIDLYLQTPDGSTRLMGSEIAPQSNITQIQWSYDPGPGTYTLFPVLVDKQSNTHPGDRNTLFIDP